MDAIDTPQEPQTQSVHQTMLAEAKERRRRALAMRREVPRKKYREIGKALGVSTERARQMVEQAEREAAAG